MKIIRTTTAERRRARTRAAITGTADRPRLSVFRSNQSVSAQLIDDTRGVTLVAASEHDLGAKPALRDPKFAKVSRAYLVGEAIAKKAVAAKIEHVVFDRGGYAFAGRVKALADGARAGGLQF